ncbi:LysM peptidoglycan-binding domain-containing protein [Spelaeicoccus albus]|uniref:LysM repeat protein n=1 Tax=Spelaeicoccus albus TaxID=1280376 RepID=A0A7Z0D2V6_9MICO|nr:LysM peptidoglycan-binding domain-containing protein [Spelaeicoccus albus]NYI67831.1 LysM repeat protein [Spelaeicoccus albus]
MSIALQGYGVQGHTLQGRALQGRAGQRRAIRRRGASAGAGRRIRLNRRGRIVVGIGAAIMVGAAALIIGGMLGIVSGAVSEAPAAASSTPAQLDVDHVTVREGQTLWQIASTAAPNADPRETILQIQKLNNLPTSAVRAGQTIAVPRY